jgi:hypothetical protein
MLKTAYSLFAAFPMYILVLACACVAADGQAASQAGQKLSLNAALLLTPEFCATVRTGKYGNTKETYQFGEAACARLEPALRNVFPSLTRVEALSSAADAQVVLIPKFLDVATKNGLALHREMVITVEWTVKDKLGKTVWIETAQGTARNSSGNSFTYKKNLKKTVEDSVESMAEDSASKMAASPELRKVAGGSSSSEPVKN